MIRDRRRQPYQVGYGKPPASGQFRKGISGNPRGRPRKKPDPYQELMAVLQEEVNITVDGQEEKVTVRRALLLRLRQEAQKGTPWAMSLVLKIMDQLPEVSDPIGEKLEDFERRIRLQKALDKLPLQDTSHHDEE